MNPSARRVTPYLRLSINPSDAPLRAGSPSGAHRNGGDPKGRTVALPAASFPSAAGLHQGNKLIIRNNHGTDALFLGGPGVTNTSGFSLPASQQIEIVREEIYGVRGGTNNIPTGVISLG